MSLEPTAAAPRPPGGGTPRYYPALDGVRALAILSVMALHYLVRAPVLPGWPGRVLHEFSLVGGYGVDLFFVLSGFLITTILLGSRESSTYFRTFYVRRALRIFPLYYAALLLIAVVLPVVMPQPFGVVREGQLSYGWFSAYLANWPIAVNGSRVSPPAMPHFWTLAIEEQFYLAWPTVVLLVAPRRLGAVCALLVVGATALRGLLVYKFHMFTAIQFATVTRLDGLALGALVAVWWSSPAAVARWRRAVHPLLWMSATAVAAFAYSRGTLQLDDNAMLIVGLPLVSVLFATLVAAVLMDGDDSLLARLFSFPPARFIGRYSYGIYVLHYPILAALSAAGFTVAALSRRFGSDVIAEVAFVGVNAAASIGAAVLSWHLLEKRFLRLKDRFPYERGAAPVLAPSRVPAP